MDRQDPNSHSVKVPCSETKVSFLFLSSWLSVEAFYHKLFRRIPGIKVYSLQSDIYPPYLY